MSTTTNDIAAEETKTAPGETEARLEEIKGATEDGPETGAEQTTETGKDATETEANQTPWQAIWSPQYNAYYFFNAETQETTWSNPLQPTEPPSSAQPEESDPTPSTSYTSALQAAALAQGIDPSLAYLDPTLASSLPGAPASSSALPSFSAKFNARTGQFTRNDARDPTHLSEYERAKRMSEFYFDVGAWEKELAQRHVPSADAEDEMGEGGDGRKRKRPTKKDLERFKEQKRLKKIAKTAWLRT